MMNTDLWVLGVLIVFFGLALIPIILLKRKAISLQKILNVLVPVSKKELFGSRNSITARQGDYSIHWEKASSGIRRFIKVTIGAANILPLPLEITNPRGLRLEHDFQNLILLEPKELAAVNRSAGREIFNRELVADINYLSRKCLGFSVFNSRITAFRTYDFSSLTMLDDFNDALVRIVTTLASTQASVDIRLYVARYALLHSAKVERRVNGLRALVRKYPTHEWTGEFLKDLVGKPEFELAVTAAEALGMDTERFAITRIGASDPENKAKAIRHLAQNKTETGFQFLLDYSPQVPEAALRREALLAIGAFKDTRAEAPLLQALSQEPVEVKSAAVAALRGCGGQDSLEPLYAVSADRSLPKDLRDAALEAGAAIRERLGKTDSGLLSLAGNAAGEGGLSKVEETKGGELSAAREDD
jgi:hypothetical protein